MVCLPFLGIINFVFISITLYANVRPHVELAVPWMRLWIFLLALIVATCAMMFLIWKFVLSPLWAFRGKQMLEKRMMAKIDEIWSILKELQNSSGAPPDSATQDSRQ